MTDMTPILITSLTQLPPVWTRGIVAPTFELALAEYERKYGAWRACWQYGNTYYFEAQP
jgi:hypothetical protein